MHIFFSNAPLHNNCLYHYDTEITTCFLELQRTKKNKHSRWIQLQWSALILTGILIFFLKIWDLINAVVNLNQGKLHDENYVQYLYCML